MALAELPECFVEPWLLGAKLGFSYRSNWKKSKHIAVYKKIE
jgi:hypothetical protein